MNINTEHLIVRRTPLKADVLMMPRAFLVKTSPRNTHGVMTSVDHHQHHHHYQHQQQQRDHDNGRFSFTTPFDQAIRDELLTTYGKLHFVCTKYLYTVLTVKFTFYHLLNYIYFCYIFYL